MKAIVRDVYGRPDVLQFEEVDRPVPGKGEVLLQVRASSLNRGDRYVLLGNPMLMRLVIGLFKPRQRGLGMDFAGEVVELGDGVGNVRVGDQVYGQVDLGETWAEFACVPADLVAPVPSGMSLQEAAAVPVSGFTALQGLRDAAQVQAGQRVLLNGATGAVGLYAVQVAKALGAHVTAVCRARNGDLVRSLGADEVIAYDEASFLDCGSTFDVVFDIVGNHSVWACRHLLNKGGVFTVVGGPEGRWLGPVMHIVGSLLVGLFLPFRVRTFTGTPNRADLLALTEMIEAGTLRSEITEVFPLEETAKALRYQKEGRPPGKVGLSMGAEGDGPA